ncbi:MAG: YceI family protein [Firmicutes bacterium]|jgi:polyisoprenoid-binding protein YceI|nr:YceI family protein [Bacillota bacterium]
MSEVVRIVDGAEVPAPGKYVIDKSHSVVGFVVKHMMVSKVRGSFKDFEGEISVADDVENSSVAVSIKLESVDTGEAQRDEHLRSGDFFDIAKNPEMTYSGNKVVRKGDKWILEGQLSINGVTKDVPLTVEFGGGGTDPYGNKRIGLSATAEINREDFGLKTNVLLETGGVLIGKEVKIEIDIEAIQQ